MQHSCCSETRSTHTSTTCSASQVPIDTSVFGSNVSQCFDKVDWTLELQVHLITVLLIEYLMDKAGVELAPLTVTNANKNDEQISLEHPPLF